MREPYLGYVLDGSKTVESRFSKNRIVPYHAVTPGEVVYFKKSGGKIVASATIQKVKYYTLTKSVREEIFTSFGEAIKISKEYIEQKVGCRYCTLMWIKDVKEIVPPVCFEKKDQRAWIVLKQPLNVPSAIS